MRKLKLIGIIMTRCIYLPPRRDDGFRISIMSRHTLADGKTPDPRIHPGSFHDHWPELGPPPKLIGAYYRGEIDWLKFADSYRRHIRSNAAAKRRIKQLIELARNSRVTLLCCEATEDVARCHRRLLAEHLLDLVGDVLTIVIN